MNIYSLKYKKGKEENTDGKQTIYEAKEVL